MITKAQAVTQRTAQEEAEYAKCEAQIDDALRGFSGRVVVNIAPSARVRMRLFEAYEKAGWKVDYGDDQRDGAWMSFE